MVNRSEHSTHTTELQLQPCDSYYDFRLADIMITCTRSDTARKRNAQTRPTPDPLVTSLPSDGTCAPLDFPERVSRELTQMSELEQELETPGYEHTERLPVPRCTSVLPEFTKPLKSKTPRARRQCGAHQHHQLSI